MLLYRLRSWTSFCRELAPQALSHSWCIAHAVIVINSGVLCSSGLRTLTLKQAATHLQSYSKRRPLRAAAQHSNSCPT